MKNIDRNRLHVRERRNAILVLFCWLAAAFAIAALVAILAALVEKGLGGLVDAVTGDHPSAAGALDELKAALLGSAMMCAFAIVIATIVGILAGTWLAEYGRESAFAQAVRFVNDILLSAPTILVALFIFGALVVPFNSYTGYAGAVALALLAVPIIARTTEDVLRMQPQLLREAGVALGAGLGRTIRRILWRGARTGMLTGILLALARISGETAPLLFTAGGAFSSGNLSEPLANLPVVIYRFAFSLSGNGQSMAWAGALLIVMAVLTINIIARVFLRRKTDH